jgi:predicted PurR-regulated permease PerM
VPNALAFAVIAAFADVIPIVGALIATIPPVAAALQDSWTKALVVLIALLAYQQFEDRYLIPRVYGRTLNLPPIIVLIAVLSGAELLGITGVLLALPLAAAGRVALDYVLENRSWLLADLTEQPFAPDLEESGLPEEEADKPEDGDPRENNPSGNGGHVEPKAEDAVDASEGPSREA